MKLTDQNCPYIKNIPLKDKDEKTNNHTDLMINNYKCINSQQIESLLSYNIFPLSFFNISSVNPTFEKYFISYFHESNLIPKILAFCETKCVSECEQQTLNLITSGISEINHPIADFLLCFLKMV